MKKYIQFIGLLTCLCSASTLASPQVTLYTTSWSMYGADYQYDGAYNNDQGGWNQHPVVTNADMQAKFAAADVIPYAFMQVWNHNDPKQAAKGVTAADDGYLHFSDLYAELPPGSDIKATEAAQHACTLMGDASCSALQMQQGSQQTVLTSYLKSLSDKPVAQLNSFGAFMDPTKYLNAKRIIAIGGANTSDNGGIGYYTFQSIFANQDTFINNLVQWVKAYPTLKGFDFDFEPPIGADGSQLPPDAQTSKDYANLMVLMQKIRANPALKNLYLSITLTPNIKYLEAINNSNSGHNWFVQMATLVDHINIMTYDFHGPWKGSDPATAIHSYLAQPSDEPNQNAVQYGAEEVMNQVLSYGVPAAKLQMGIATYGRAYAGVPNANTSSKVNLPGLNQTWAAASSDPTVTAGAQAGLMLYKSVPILLKQGYTQYDVHKAPDQNATEIVGSYLYNPAVANGTFIGYESPAEIQSVCQYVKDKKLGGVIFWEVSSDLPVSDANSLLATFKKCSS